jgi:hypothetical protein
MKIAVLLAILIISVDCFGQTAKTNEIIDSAPNDMDQNELPKDLVNKFGEFTKDSIVWISLDQKEYCGDYLKLENKIHCGSLRCYTTPLKVDVASFQVLYSTPFSRDMRNVYCYNSLTCEDCNGCCGGCWCDIFIVENANPNTFRYLSNSYAIDEIHVYYQGLLIKDADAVTFNVLNGPKNFDFAIDKNHVYKWNETFKDADPSTFYYDKTNERNNEYKFIIGDRNNKWEYDLSKNTIIKIDK